MYNKVILIGNLGKDPEFKQLDNGSACRISMATTRKYKNHAGEVVTDTRWHLVECFGSLADNCAQYLGKGSKICVEGSLKTKRWKDKNGNDRSQVVIVAGSIQFLTTKEQNQQTEPTGEYTY